MNNIFHSIRFKLIVFSIVIEIIMLSLLIFNANRLISNHLTTETYKQIEIIKSIIKIIPNIIGVIASSYNDNSPVNSSLINNKK